MTFLSAALFLTYGGEFISTDEMYLFDATESLVRRGDLQLNLTSSLRSIMLLDSEPMQVVAAAPLFWVVERLPGVGMVHGLLVFNNLVTSATAALLFFYALALGYGPGAALALGLLFGLGTIAWPYSKTFFREPLLSFFLLLSAYALERWRRAFAAGAAGWGWLGLGILAGAGALLTKAAALLALPALAILAMPKPGKATMWWPRLRRVLVVLVLAGIGIAAVLLVAAPSRYQIGDLWERAKLAWLPDAVGGYLISPGKSLFVYSPALLLGLIGMVMLGRRRAWRYVLAPLVLVTCFVLGYAILRHAEWIGGTGWGPRYMVPLTAFLLLPALPVVHRLFTRAQAWTRVAATYLVLLSVGVQIVGTVVPVHSYYPWIRGGTAWDVGVWVLTQTHIFINLVLMRLFGERDVAWWNMGRDLSIPALCGLLMALTVGGMVYAWRRALEARQVAALALAAATLTGGIFTYALTRYTAADDRYMVSEAQLHQMLDYLNQNAAPDDVIFLSNPRYQLFFYNFNKRPGLHVVSLPNSPGEQPSPEQPPLVVSDNPEHLILKWIARTVNQLADQHDTLWLLVDSNRYVTWSVRPVEQWMAHHYFPIDDYEVAPQVRVVRYSAADPPPPSAPPWPHHPSGVTFGDTFTLIGYDLVGEAYRAGEAVNLSLMWRVEASPDTDYTVGLFVIGTGGLPCAARHSAPVGGFGLTYFWEPGEVWRDNHALLLPADLPPGRYSLRLILYTWQDGQRLPITGSDGQALGDAVDIGTVTVAE
jgi:hypothetical protein